jgi:hypothetical protein
MRALALLLILAPAAGAVSLSGADFLNQSQDVRSVGMGETGQASASGVEGLTTNPAAIHDIAAQEAYFTHQLLGNGIGSDYAAWGMTRGANHFALSLLHVGYGALDGRDDSGNDLGGFSPSADVYELAYGTTLGPVELAAAYKRVDFKIATTASANTFDAGARYRLDDEWSFGVSGENLGGDLTFDGASSPLPSRIGGGASWRAGTDWTLSADLIGPLYSPMYAALGGEYRLRVNDAFAAFLRVGLNTRTPDAGSFAGLKIGLGAAFRGISIDYAFAPGAAVGDEHLFGLTWRFGAAAVSKGPAPQ